MSTIPEEAPLAERLSNWYKLSKELKLLRVKEMLLRKSLFATMFPDPDEGVNKYDLDDGYVVKGTYALERKIDQGAFDAMKEKLIEAEVKVDAIVTYAPSLAKKVYNALNEDQVNLMDQCLIIKPASPSMEIVKPKAAK